MIFFMVFSFEFQFVGFRVRRGCFPDVLNMAANRRMLKSRLDRARSHGFSPPCAMRVGRVAQTPIAPGNLKKRRRRAVLQILTSAKSEGEGQMRRPQRTIAVQICTDLKSSERGANRRSKRLKIPISARFSRISGPFVTKAGHAGANHMQEAN
jgi:hypothetical protein